VRERNVETSTVSSPNITCTSLKRLTIRRDPEDLVHILGIRVGGYVEVLGGAGPATGRAPAPPTTYASWPWLCSNLADLARALRDRLAADSVLLLRDGSRPGAGAEPEDAPNEFLDQEGKKNSGCRAASREHWYSASRLAWVSISLACPRRARPASYSKTAKPQCRAACRARAAPREPFSRRTRIGRRFASPAPGGAGPGAAAAHRAAGSPRPAAGPARCAPAGALRRKACGSLELRARPGASSASQRRAAAAPSSSRLQRLECG